MIALLHFFFARRDFRILKILVHKKDFIYTVPCGSMSGNLKAAGDELPMKIKRMLCALLLAAVLLSLSTAAYADGTHQIRAVIGADLTDEQVTAVYNAFGVSRGSVVELKVTNQEERQYLEGYVDPSVIGTRSISSVYVELLDEGDGMNVTTSNISWCTGEM